MHLAQYGIQYRALGCKLMSLPVPNEGRELLDKLMTIILSRSIRLRGVNDVFNCTYLIDDFVKTY